MTDPVTIGNATLYCGDCRSVLTTLAPDSIDAVVTDPPYHLTSIVKRFANASADREQYAATSNSAYMSRGFMGKTWDGGAVAFDPDTWRAVYRVLKPGAHLVACGGTRTYHRMACAIEDAGFEIRDTISWLYGSGFPKSRNIGKGWGTALKPACELIVLARKPLSEGTVAANVLRWGTGAINVDGCRVPGAFESGWSQSGSKAGKNTCMSGPNYARDPKPDNSVGRWPANVAHDGSDEVTAAFPDVHSAGASCGPKFEGGNPNGVAYKHGGNGFRIGDDSGSAARFFYTAKADADDRLGSRHPTVKPLDLMQWLVRLVTPKGGTVLDPFAGTGTTGEAAWREGMRAVLIEAEPEYQADIRRRMALVLAGPDERMRESIKAKNLPRDDGPLFATRDATWSDMWAKPFDFSKEPQP
jgi:site-specific DNA-methyltransferase (adenine-specific)